MIPSYWQQAIAHLSFKDTVLAQLINLYPDTTLTNLGNPFHTLMRAVVGQQISVKAADAIWQRLELEIKIIVPCQFLVTAQDKLRQCGLSRQKITYITEIARAFEEKILTPELWYEMSDREIIEQLVSIKGIGIWTAQMFLIFHLHRPDILPLSDLGLINAIKIHYGNLHKSEMLALAQKWQPYRTVATCYLWRSIDPVTVQY
jgi:DNA-3-methyladenine glycosylase II